MKTETLSSKRRELFEIMIKKMPTAGRIYRIIKAQDKEFIQKLKELLFNWDESKQGSFYGVNINYEIDELAGEELIK